MHTKIKYRTIILVIILIFILFGLLFTSDAQIENTHIGELCTLDFYGYWNVRHYTSILYNSIDRLNPNSCYELYEIIQTDDERYNLWFRVRGENGLIGYAVTDVNNNIFVVHVFPIEEKKIPSLEIRRYKLIYYDRWFVEFIP